MEKDQSTVFAPASGAGPAGVAVIRISGPASGAALYRLCQCELPPPRRLARVQVSDPVSGNVLDDGLAAWFPAPASFTGEDVVELHIHGGRAVLDAVLDALGRCPGLEPAEPGAFTRRAFENGKLDLTAAEGLADLVTAETEGQRRQALRQMQGELGRLYEAWRQRLLENLAHLEAAIDFSDEDLPGDLADCIRVDVGKLLKEVDGHLADGHRGERLRDGFHVAILGPPNVGKSSLLNRLARREAAIVAETAGTTRDVIEVHLDLGGYPVVLADTAGLRDSDDLVEAEGVRRAALRGRESDLRVVVLDASDWPEIDPPTRDMMDGEAVVVVNKIDLGEPKPPLLIGDQTVHPVSALTGEGFDGLLERLTTTVAERLAEGGAPALTRARHRRALENCRAALGRYLDAGADELAAEDLRLAVRALGRVTGRVDVEDLLDVIFRDFCIGK